MAISVENHTYTSPSGRHGVICENNLTLSLMGFPLEFVIGTGVSRN